MLYAFFWVIPRRLDFICRHMKFRRRGITQNKAYNMDKVSWTECVKNKEVLHTFKQEVNILYRIKEKKKEGQPDWSFLG